ncbi:hypothetical protein L1D09_21575 [Vibrio tubiashii]|uniref:hypothetical protein n=1 Tax=Vibrio tubiashii TaxID=29498 RepID=UPI001EFD0E00|nr:hypothetical protein [Vibrio tubiashii]MCG9584121.1 hypothetical protein [Vibrio tubiashii]MCG9617716.1 hypothetical protein [Vibrio tubiashii]
MKILLGPARPSLVSYFDELANSLRSESFECLTFGDTKDSKCDLNLFSGIYEEIRDLKDIVVGFEYGSDYEEIVMRDRYLSNIPFNDAVKVVYTVRKNINRILDEVKPDYIFGDRVDNYILHIFYLECMNRRIEYNIVLESYIPGYTRFSDINGGIKKIRDSKSDEVERITKKIISNTYRPDYFDYQEIELSPLSIFSKLYIKEKVKVIYFSLAKYLSGDFLNFHYNTSLMSDKYNFPGVRYFNQIFYNKHVDYDWDKSNVGKTKVYIPLQWFPETSTCYFPKNKEFVFYFESILNVLSNLKESGDFEVYIKEHPFCVGHRKPYIYEKMKKAGNVKIIPSSVHNDKIFQFIDITIAWQGTTGLESLLRGKSTIFIDKPYYLDSGNYNIVDEFSETKSIARVAKEIIDNSDVEKDNKQSEKLIKYGLDGSFEAKLKLMWFDNNSRSELDELEKVSNQISAYINNNIK